MDNSNLQLFDSIFSTIENLDLNTVTEERRQLLQPLIDYIQLKHSNGEDIRLNFICTHNSRRSHLSQVWAQTLAAFYKINSVFCYSGGTEATAMFPVVGDTLINTGFSINKLSEESNPVYAIKFGDNFNPIIAFSKTFDNGFNPKSHFAAIMTCNNADENCPFIPGAEKRIPVTYVDPKISDNTPKQKETYMERSLEIATELKYVFSNITK